MQRRSLGIYNWYIILDSILASNTVGGLLVNCKNSLSQVFFEVLDFSTSLFVWFFFHVFHAQAQILKVSGWRQVHDVLFKSRTCKVQYFVNKQKQYTPPIISYHIPCSCFREKFADELFKQSFD